MGQHENPWDMARMEVFSLFQSVLGEDLVNYPLHPQSSPIRAVIAPKNPLELQKAIATASQYQIPVVTLSSLNWGGLVKLPQPGIALDLSHLNELVDHAVGDLTVTCGAGMKFTDLQAILAKAGQFLAIDPILSDRLTIGEIIDTANTGSLRQRYGGIRDMLLGISFVRADGELVKAGGRVVKNVAGYDLMKLLTGAYGSLGIITQATFRLYPLPLCDRTVVVTGNKLDQLRGELLLSSLTPIAMDLWAPDHHSRQLVIRFGGWAESVTTQIERLQTMAAQLGLEVTPDDQIWSKILAMASPILAKIGTLPDQAFATADAIQAIAPGQVQIHAASGLGLARFCQLNSSQINQIRQKHFLTILQAPDALKAGVDLWGYQGNAGNIMAALKQKFDPHNLLNPHILAFGISQQE